MPAPKPGEPDWRTEREIERDEAGIKKADQRIKGCRDKHRFERPLRMPTAVCVCGARTVAPGDMGVIRQRDYCLDWFNSHLADMRAARRLARAGSTPRLTSNDE